MKNFTFAQFNNNFYKKLTQDFWAEFENKNEAVSTQLLSEIPSFESVSKALLKEECAAAIFPLSMIPIEKPEGIVITALSKRQKENETLLVKKESAAAGKLLKLPEGGSVSVFTEMQKIQLQNFRPDLNFTQLDWSYFFENESLNFETDGMVLPAAFAEMIEYNHIAFPLQSSEFIPTPGQGVLAFLTLKDNLPGRRFLKKMHHKDVSACTNIERGLQRKLDQPIACFCLKNDQGHFETWAASLSNKLNYSKIASGTSIGLVDKLANELN